MVRFLLEPEPLFIWVPTSVVPAGWIDICAHWPMSCGMWQVAHAGLDEDANIAQGNIRYFEPPPPQGTADYVVCTYGTTLKYYVYSTSADPIFSMLTVGKQKMCVFVGKSYFCIVYWIRLPYSSFFHKLWVPGYRIGNQAWPTYRYHRLKYIFFIFFCEKCKKLCINVICSGSFESITGKSRTW